ncbi:MAG: hypoxanthine phosphoribosyltransferase [Verrucomicrobiota bacterium]
MRDDLESVLFPEEQIADRVKELGLQLSQDFAGRDLSVLILLHGGMMFAADLIRHISLPLTVETLAVASYKGEQSSGQLEWPKELRFGDLQGRDLLIVDDILDTGTTLSGVRERMGEEFHPESIQVCVLLDKLRPRIRHVEPDYVGFEVEDVFVVGYGLDYNARYRNLPYIGVLKEECI